MRYSCWRGFLDSGEPRCIAFGGVPADEAIIIGDSSVDVLTGRNAGLWTCGVTYGFAPRSLAEVPPDVVMESPRELAELLQ